MRILVVTSEVTFVDRNYDALVLPLVQHPAVVGLVVLRNRNWKLVLQGLLFWATRLAPGIGKNLFPNCLGMSAKRRRETCLQNGKLFREFETVNHNSFVQFVRDQKIDVIFNARTRFIYRRNVLLAPKVGCVNIHHGLLPDQRGVMCDLWSLSEGRAAGFSIHRMSERIDDGPILKTRVVAEAKESKNFEAYLSHAARIEALEVCSFFDALATADDPKRLLEGKPNIATELRPMRRNPTLRRLIQWRTQEGMWI